MDRPQVSVIIPVYNGDFIEDCIASCFKQSIPVEAMEVIVVDDASTDDTAQRLRTIQAEHPINIISLDRNGGPARARNAGLEAAMGSYVAFLDSDDMMHPQKLEQQLKYFEETTDVQVVISGIEEIDSKGQVLRQLIRPFPADQKAQVSILFLDNLHTITSTMLFQRSLLGSVGHMNEALANMEDMEFALRLLQKTRIHYIRRALTVRRVLISGLSQSVTEQNFLQSRGDFLKASLDRYPFLKDLEDRYWSLNFARLGRVLQRRGHGTRARSYYLQSIRHRLNSIAILGLGLTIFPRSMQKALAGSNWKKR